MVLDVLTNRWDSYARTGYVVLNHFLDPTEASTWEARYRHLPQQRVHVGQSFDSRWGEQRIADPSLALDGMLCSDEFLAFIGSISGIAVFDRQRTAVWINRYRPGEYVPEHIDHEGDTQLLICLQGLPDSCEGELRIRDEVVPLKTGDAVLFRASEVAHSTAPITGTEVGPSGYSRVTLVIRLFSATLDSGDSQR